MYSFLIALHSLTRWVVLAALLFAIYRAYSGWLRKQAYTRTDNIARSLTVTIAHIQLVIGVWLYLKSPMVSYFYSYFSKAVHERQPRFFGMEHIVMMLLAVVFITIGGSKARRRKIDEKKFKAMAVWFTIALVIIFLSIPWPFSPFTARPWLRAFYF